MKKIQAMPIGENIIKNNEQNHYRCALCKDKGFYFKGNIAVTCICSKRKLKGAQKEKCGITPRLAKETFESFDFSFYADDQRGNSRLTYRDVAKAAYKAAKQFTKDYLAGKNPDGLLFQGAVGSGKTYLAAAIANELLDNGAIVEYIVVPDYLDMLRDSFHDYSELQEGMLMQKAKTAPVLILDDLGAHNYTDWSIKTIFAILNYRLNYEYPTIVTTNLENKEIEELLGSRIYSRLVESCRFFRLENTKDIRMEKRIREIKRG